MNNIFLYILLNILLVITGCELKLAPELEKVIKPDKFTGIPLTVKGVYNEGKKTGNLYITIECDSLGNNFVVFGEAEDIEASLTQLNIYVAKIEHAISDKEMISLCGKINRKIPFININILSFIIKKYEDDLLINPSLF